MILALALLLACSEKNDDDDDGSSDDTSPPTDGGQSDGGQSDGGMPDGGGNDGGGSDGGGNDGGGSDGGGSDGGSDGGGDTGEPPLPPELVTFTGSVRAFDPLRGGAMDLSVELVPHSFSPVLDLRVVDAVGTVVATLADDLAPTPGESGEVPSLATLRWDGRDEEGIALPAGAYAVQVDIVLDGAVLASQQVEAFVLRTGLSSGLYGGPKLEDDDRVALLWHKNEGFSTYWNDGAITEAFAVATASVGEGVKELATEVPALWDDLEHPPGKGDEACLPQAYPYTATPYLTLGLHTEGLAPAAEAGEWTAALEGWTLVGGSVAEGTLVFQKDEALADGLKVLEGAWTFSLALDDQLVTTQAVPYRIYATMGQPTFESISSPHMLWVAVADDALRALDGIEPTDTAILDALVEWVYRDGGLTYDTVSGGSFYSSYPRGWERGQINFSAYLDRSAGSIVNCSDCAGIVGTYANMLGVALDYSIILSGYALNEIKAIGISEFTSCPFGPYSCGFSYHAVNTNDVSAHIWDATLALDGDEDPGTSPSEELLVQEIDGEEYLFRLVRSGSADYYYDTSRIRIY